MPAKKPNTIAAINDHDVIVDVSSPKFPGATTRIDRSDLEIITSSPRRWYVAKTRAGSPYVVRNVGPKESQRTELLHRVLLGLTETDNPGDHKNGNTLDNRRSNLRSATISQNLRNQRGHRNSSSQYLGVSWCERDQVWRAHCQIDKNHRALGSYKTEIEAARAYDDAVRHDPFANLNFS